MNFELRKKFKGMEFRDLYELATMAARYEKILLDEQEMKNSSRGTYYKDPNLEVLVAEYDIDLGEVDMAELTCKRPVVCKALQRSTEGSNDTSTIKKQAFEPGKVYTFDLSLADQIFDALHAEKLIRLNNGHRMPKAEDMKGKEIGRANV